MEKFTFLENERNTLKTKQFKKKKRYINWKYEKEGNPLEVLLKVLKKPWDLNKLSENPKFFLSNNLFNNFELIIFI